MINFRLKKQGEDVLDTVLLNRGIDELELEGILNPSELVIESPKKFKNMDNALSKVITAINNNKKIAVPIDSDCDGWCSASLLYDTIKYELGYGNIEYFFHDNPKAHGFTDHVVKQLKKMKAELVIMCDGGCGDNDRKKYQTVLDNGTDIVILDHHPFTGTYQDEVALVNCCQKGDNTNPNLSGAGVTFKFVEALTEELGVPHKAEKYRDLVALSIVSDLMDLRELENRALLKLGNKEEAIQSPFIKRVMETKKMEGYLTIEELGFNVAPLINATVRLGTAKDKEKVFRSLFISEEVESEKRGEKGKGIFVPLENEAVRIATNLKSKQDKKRDKAMEAIITDMEVKNLNDNKVFIADITDHAEGEIIGLVANKLLDLVNKPIILVRKNKEGDGWLGSARGLTESKELPNFKEVCINTKFFDFCSGHDNAFGVGISLDAKTKLDIKKKAEKDIKEMFIERLESEEIDKKEFNKAVKEASKDIMNLEREVKLKEVAQKLNESLNGIEFFDGYEVDKYYNCVIPLADVKAVAKYEDLWCNNIKAPLFLVKGVKIKSADIEKIGNATYTFKVGDVKFTKNFGSKQWYSDVTLEEELPFGGDLICDIVVKFRKNKRGYYYCDIVDMKTREDLEGDMDF